MTHDLLPCSPSDGNYLEAQSASCQIKSSVRGLVAKGYLPVEEGRTSPALCTSNARTHTFAGSSLKSGSGTFNSALKSANAAQRYSVSATSLHWWSSGYKLLFLHYRTFPDVNGYVKLIKVVSSKFICVRGRSEAPVRYRTLLISWSTWIRYSEEQITLGVFGILQYETSNEGHRLSILRKSKGLDK